MNQMNTEDVLNLYRQGHRLSEGDQYIRSLATDITCTSADIDPYHDSWFCSGYKVGKVLPYVAIGGIVLYYVTKKK